MHKTIISIMILFTFSLGAVAAPIKGSGATSCGSWLKERRNGTYAIDLNWVLGFISAYNHYLESSTTGNGVYGSTDIEGIAAWMDNYCSSNPLSNPYTGSVKLIEELRSK
ncbi:hypothetical protein F9L16_11200 [Agarivorans sp. B2Z047]|uniref:hypothetical protein n=1 Tax=Agarivorans sp. B2Z047 TaxID=2652721 RepID=UPI00128B9B11|nr:hypothetical protein [Agarivorans sp. B2Z047]MPW29566.1 hypothetical protein [Agarivorans sp. B2Z047]UQN45154.1 hypothetical protein LQZ07_11980 [Agarivorans sp. B2Z047]